MYTRKGNTYVPPHGIGNLVQSCSGLSKALWGDERRAGVMRFFLVPLVNTGFVADIQLIYCGTFR